MQWCIMQWSELQGNVSFKSHVLYLTSNYNRALPKVPKVFKLAIETLKLLRQTLKFTNVAMNSIDPTICEIALSMSILTSERFGLTLSERGICSKMP